MLPPHGHKESPSVAFLLEGRKPGIHETKCLSPIRRCFRFRCAVSLSHTAGTLADHAAQSRSQPQQRAPHRQMGLFVRVRTVRDQVGYHALELSRQVSRFLSLAFSLSLAFQNFDSLHPESVVVQAEASLHMSTHNRHQRL